MARSGIYLLERQGDYMKDIAALAIVASLLLVSLSVIYCADAVLTEMAKQRNLMELQFGVTNGQINSKYSETLVNRSGESKLHATQLPDA